MAYNGLIHVLLVDDHAIVREGLRAMLSECAGAKIVGEAGSGHEVLKLINKIKPDVVLLDIRMPRMDGFATLVQLKAKYPETKVIMLSATGLPEEVTRARELGARGFISKDAECEEVCATISKVGHGGEHWPQVRRQRRVAPLKLSRREIQVLESARTGQSKASIGRALKINEQTFESLVRNLLTKLRVSDLAGAVVRGCETGLLPQLH